MRDERTRSRGTRFGIAGLVLLLLSWLVMFFERKIAPEWAPYAWLIVLIVVSGALVAGILAGRMSSRRWYVVSGVAFLAADVILAGLAV